MDCEKFDQVLIDALYDELDELTLAAAKRHADACVRCHAAWSGLKATRKIGVLPLVEAPAGFEARVLAAAREAQRHVPWPKRLGRAISWAGSYAMRPQTAMAALLLLMLGSSVIFVRVKPDRSGSPSRVRVTERGVPEQAAGELHAEAPPAEAWPAFRPALVDDRTVAVAPLATAAPPARDMANEAESRSARVAEKSEAFAEAPPAARRATEPVAGLGDPSAGTQDRAKGDMEGSGASMPRTLGAAAAGQQKDAYSSAMDLYATGRYAEAEKAFAVIAQSTSKNAPNAALYQAKSAEAGFGCGKAAKMYEAAASRYGATTPGAEALWGAANCYKATGGFEKATVFYNELRKVAGYRDRAEAELENMRALQQSHVASRKAAAAEAKSPAAPPPAAAAPAAPAGRPPTSNAAERPAQ
jgi:TolA-binding protein